MKKRVAYASIFVNLNRKNFLSMMPRNRALNCFTFALKDSADAFVDRLTK